MLDFEEVKKVEVENFMRFLTLYYDLEIGQHVDNKRITDAINELQMCVNYLHEKLK